MRVVFSRRADRQIEAAERWRKEHRAGPIRDAFAWLIDHLESNPHMGQVHEHARRPGLRRWYLEAIGYVVFWRVDERRGEVRITEIRHARRRPIRM